MAVDPVDTFNNITGWYHLSRNCTGNLLPWNNVIKVSAYARCDINKDGRFCVNVTLVSKVLCHLPGYMGRNLQTSWKYF